MSGSSKGIWTKHLVPSDASEGNVADEKSNRYFYFNAFLNKSSWFPPKDGIVHEAAQLGGDIIVEECLNDTKETLIHPVDFMTSGSISNKPAMPVNILKSSDIQELISQAVNKQRITKKS